MEYTKPQTQDMAPHPVTVYSQTRGRHVAVLLIDACSHHYFSYMKVLHNSGHALSSWKMSPEPTAAILKGITTGFNEIIMQMHSQNPMALHTFDLISVIFFFAHPNLSKLICESHMNMIRNNFLHVFKAQYLKVY